MPPSHGSRAAMPRAAWWCARPSVSWCLPSSRRHRKMVILRSEASDRGLLCVAPPVTAWWRGSGLGVVWRFRALDGPRRSFQRVARALQAPPAASWGVGGWSSCGAVSSPTLEVPRWTWWRPILTRGRPPGCAHLRGRPSSACWWSAPWRFKTTTVRLGIRFTSVSMSRKKKSRR